MVEYDPKNKDKDYKENKSSTLTNVASVLTLGIVGSDTPKSTKEEQRKYRGKGKVDGWD